MTKADARDIVAVVAILHFAYFTAGVRVERDVRSLDRNLIVLSPEFTEDNLPKFVPPLQNTTATVGHNALLACVVDNLQMYKVSWVKEATGSVLTVHQSVTTKDTRITLSYNDHRSWYLHLRDVREEDRGWYICQINTDPVTNQSVYLQVLVPPRIIDEETTKDLVARELSDVTLQCRATGFPEPYVIWRRADGNDFHYRGEKVNVVDGEKLHFNKISRLHMGTYFCVAQNGISPTINRQITLTVHFPPILHVPNQLVGATLNQRISLLCISEAYPKSINFWTRGNGEMIVSDEIHEIVYSTDMYTTSMMITIHEVASYDYGTYICVSVNPLGTTDGIIKLYEITPPIEYEWKSSMTPNDNGTKTDEKLADILPALNSTSSSPIFRPKPISVAILSTLIQMITFYLCINYQDEMSLQLNFHTKLMLEPASFAIAAIVVVVVVHTAKITS